MLSAAMMVCVGDLEITAIEKREATGRRHWREVRSVSVCVYTTI